MRRLSDRMRPVFLDFDSTFDGQQALVAEALLADGQRVAATDLEPTLRLWASPPAIEALRGRLQYAVSAAGPKLVFAGSGDFHHITPLLVERALDASDTGPVTVIHVDSHPDWAVFDEGLHCGSWAGRVARLPGVSRLITIGVRGEDVAGPTAGDLELIADGRLELYAYRGPCGSRGTSLCGQDWPTVEGLGEAASIDLLVSRIETDAVYITIDKQVLCCAPDRGAGQMSFALLERLIQRIVDHHRVIGADVVGDGPPLESGAASHGLKRRSAEAINRRLLRLFVQVSA